MQGMQEGKQASAPTLLRASPLWTSSVGTSRSPTTCPLAGSRVSSRAVGGASWHSLVIASEIFPLACRAGRILQQVAGGGVGSRNAGWQGCEQHRRARGEQRASSALPAQLTADSRYFPNSTSVMSMAAVSKKSVGW